MKFGAAWCEGGRRGELIASTALEAWEVTFSSTYSSWDPDPGDLYEHDSRVKQGRARQIIHS